MEADISSQAVGLATNTDFSLIKLFLRADIIVKSVMILLIGCSIYSWAIIIEKIRLFKGRSSKGIRGINLKEKDAIVSLSTIDKDSKNGKKGDKYILSVTENGFGKRTASNEFRVTNRGGKGIIGIVNSSRNGNVSSSFPVFEGDEILISTNKGRVIRVAVKEIRIAGRNTQGVRIIRLSGDEKVVSAIKIDDNLL